MLSATIHNSRREAVRVAAEAARIHDQHVALSIAARKRTKALTALHGACTCRDGFGGPALFHKTGCPARQRRV